ncbi:MAG: adenosylcobinamide-GDP ribazoletransferase [Aciduliprofundum sp.]|jgi:adenosylcobinamide-GDP ribazoletransferase|nr:adenosylcobinamide-GDP ribazoletransferase [Thermoplasmatales archaeon]PMP75167.1 MAG: adenosylcobinamide-GDP ribazoletransferase [Aciduliprofundum sp.]
MYLNILMLSLLSFFTRIPAKGSIEDASRETFLLPLIALIISIPAALIYYLLLPLPPQIRSILAILVIYSINGLIHLDGLADFSDGLMVKGDREKKVKALKDVNTGIAGSFSIIMLILTEIFSLISLRISIFNIFSFFILSEISAKFSMMGGLLNRPFGEGLGSLFQKNFRITYMITGIIITLPLFLIFHMYYIISFTGFIVSAIISYISRINFGMVNGDCLGAMNEISRAVTMVLLCLVL